MYWAASRKDPRNLAQEPLNNPPILSCLVGQALSPANPGYQSPPTPCQECRQRRSRKVSSPARVAARPMRNLGPGCNHY
ncbi:hypothetical protein SBA4_4100003 [Candidatus Sulfopaludibacter sp. SbA4]|nr:hypothetical protein SBA4_4100003 [Candidatus Sulfopaludibacter sp. SbA4]